VETARWWSGKSIVHDIGLCGNWDGDRVVVDAVGIGMQAYVYRDCWDGLRIRGHQWEWR